MCKRILGVLTKINIDVANSMGLAMTSLHAMATISIISFCSLHIELDTEDSEI
jgi:hypothetical protein